MGRSSFGLQPLFSIALLVLSRWPVREAPVGVVRRQTPHPRTGPASPARVPDSPEVDGQGPGGADLVEALTRSTAEHRGAPDERAPRLFVGDRSFRVDVRSIQTAPEGRSHCPNQAHHQVTRAPWLKEVSPPLNGIITS